MAMRLSLQGSAPVVLIEKTIHLIDDGCQYLRILLSLRHLLQTSPAFGFIHSFHGGLSSTVSIAVWLP